MALVAGESLSIEKCVHGYIITLANGDKYVYESMTGVNDFLAQQLA